MSKFGDFGDFCRDSTLPVCNLFNTQTAPTCVLEGFVTSNGHRVRNLGKFRSLLTSDDEQAIRYYVE